MMASRALSLTLVTLSLAVCLPAQAVVTRLYPLSQIIADADSIAVAQVTTPAKHGKPVNLKITATLKGQLAGPTTANLHGGDDRSQLAVIRKRLVPGKPFVLFIKTGRFALGFAEGGWFRLAAPKAGTGPWQFVHLEPYLRRTYHGSTAALQQTITDALAGKTPAPEPDPKVKPGF